MPPLHDLVFWSRRFSNGCVYGLLVKAWEAKQVVTQLVDRFFQPLAGLSFALLLLFVPVSPLSLPSLVVLLSESVQSCQLLV